MGNHDTYWEQLRDELAHSIDYETRDRITGLLDLAAAAARANQLGEAARHLEAARRELVQVGAFNRWDNGIWWFVGIIKVIRGMSGETTPPGSYQKLLDAIPSARIDRDMSLTQLTFWYGEADERVIQGTLKREKNQEIMMSAIVCGVILLVILYFNYG